MDFGIIVDGAVIVLENVFRALCRRQRRHDRRDARDGHHRRGRAKSGGPTLFSMLIIIIAHLPIFTLQRHEGRIFAPMAYTVVSALIGSLLFSLTLVPLLCFCSAGAKRAARRQRARATGCKRAVPAACCACALERPVARAGGARSWRSLGSLALVPRLGSEFLPELNEGIDLGQHHAAAGHLGERGVAAVRADPADRSASFRKCAR